VGRVTIAGLLAHKLRLALTAFAIVLGVSFVSATLTLSNGLQTTFDNIFTNQSTGVAVVVRGHLDASGQNGGFSDAPKFPRPSEPAYLLRYGTRFQDDEAVRLLEPGVAVSRRRTPGGAGPAAVAEQMKQFRDHLARDRARLDAADG